MPSSEYPIMEKDDIFGPLSPKTESELITRGLADINQMTIIFQNMEFTQDQAMDMMFTDPYNMLCPDTGMSELAETESFTAVGTAELEAQPSDTASIVSGPSQSKLGKYAKPSEWEQHRPKITRLYMDEKRTLVQVKDAMEREDGFVATLKMYKDRINKRWGLYHYNRDPKLKRKWSSAFSQLSDADSLASYRPVQPREFTLPTPPASEVSSDQVLSPKTTRRLPPKEDLQKFLGSPGALKPVDKILVNVKAWIDVYQKSGYWGVLKGTLLIHSVNTGATLSRFLAILGQGRRLFLSGALQVGSRLLNLACAQIKSVLLEQNPALVTALIREIFATRAPRVDRRAAEMHAVILKHAHCISVIKLGNTHPLTGILAGLREIAVSFDAGDPSAVVMTAGMISNCFNTAVGPFEASTSLPRRVCWEIAAIVSGGDPYEGEKQRIVHLLSRLEKLSNGMKAEDHIRLLKCELSDLYQLQGKNQEALDILSSMFHDGSRTDKLDALQRRGTIEWSLGRPNDARKSIRECLYLSDRCFGKVSPGSLESLMLLVDVATELGDRMAAYRYASRLRCRLEWLAEGLGDKSAF